MYLDLSVNANYESAPSGNTFAQTAYSSLFTAFDNSPFGTGEGSTVIKDEFGDALTGGDMIGKGDPTSAPRAFLNYILFDKEMSYKTAGFQQISTAALGTGVHETISINDIKPEQDGYILMYLSNENNETVNIHWDDFTVYHGKTNVVSVQDYYPFGLTFNESVRVASKKNFMNTFQDQEYEEETGWVKFKWRNHQPDIGRFFNVDPLSDKYVHNSVYAFSENKVVRHIELEGLEARPAPRPGTRNSVLNNRIRDVVSEAARTYRSGLATPGSRQTAQFTSTTKFNVGRGNGTASGGTGNVGFSDRNHEMGNTAGGVMKVTNQITRAAIDILDKAEVLYKNEHFVKSGTWSISLGFDIVVDDMQTTLQLVGLQKLYEEKILKEAQGDLTDEEFENADDRAGRMFMARMNAGSASAQMFFTTTTSTSESGTMLLDFPIEPNSGYTEYVVMLQNVTFGVLRYKQKVLAFGKGAVMVLG